MVKLWITVKRPRYKYTASGTAHCEWALNASANHDIWYNSMLPTVWKQYLGSQSWHRGVIHSHRSQQRLWSLLVNFCLEYMLFFYFRKLLLMLYKIEGDMFIYQCLIAKSENSLQCLQLLGSLMGFTTYLEYKNTLISRSLHRYTLDQLHANFLNPCSEVFHPLRGSSGKFLSMHIY